MGSFITLPPLLDFERLRLVRIISPSDLLRTLAVSPCKLVLIPQVSEGDPLYSPFLAIKDTASKIMPSRQQPLWLMLSKDDQGDLQTRGELLDVLESDTALTQLKHRSIYTALNMSPVIYGEEYLDPNLIQGSLNESADEIHHSLDALNESLPFIKKDMKTIMAKLKEAIHKESVSGVAQAVPYLSAVLGQYGDLHARSLLDQWLRDFRDHGKILTSLDFSQLSRCVIRSLESISLYRVALELDLKRETKSKLKPVLRRDGKRQPPGELSFQ